MYCLTTTCASPPTGIPALVSSTFPVVEEVDTTVLAQNDPTNLMNPNNPLYSAPRSESSQTLEQHGSQTLVVSNCYQTVRISIDFILNLLLNNDLNTSHPLKEKTL